MSIDPKATHYDAGGIETFEIIRAKLTPEQFCGYLLGNTIKYSTRLNFKGHEARDADKLAHYSCMLAEAMEDVPDVFDWRIVGDDFESDDSGAVRIPDGHVWEVCDDPGDTHCVMRCHFVHKSQYYRDITNAMGTESGR